MQYAPTGHTPAVLLANGDPGWGGVGFSLATPQIKEVESHEAPPRGWTAPLWCDGGRPPMACPMACPIPAPTRVVFSLDDAGDERGSVDVPAEGQLELGQLRAAAHKLSEGVSAEAAAVAHAEASQLGERPRECRHAPVCQQLQT